MKQRYNKFTDSYCKHPDIRNLSGMGIINYYCPDCKCHFYKGVNSGSLKKYTEKEWDKYVEL